MRRHLSVAGAVASLVGSCDAADEHGVDAVAPAADVLGGELEPVHDRFRARDRHPAERLGEQAADRLDVVAVGQLDVEQLGEILDRQPGGDPGGVVVDALDRRAARRRTRR